jgi:hypothetical protein
VLKPFSPCVQDVLEALKSIYPTTWASEDYARQSDGRGSPSSAAGAGTYAGGTQPSHYGEGYYAHDAAGEYGNVDDSYVVDHGSNSGWGRDSGTEPGEDSWEDGDEDGDE